MSWIIEENLDPKLQDWGEAYKELCAIIKAKVPEVKHIDFYYGQDQFVEQDGNWNPFPCPAVLLNFRAAQVQDLGDNTQQLTMDITMYLYMETVQDTHHGSAGQRRAMEFVGLMRKLHLAMHGTAGDHFSPMSRVDMAQKTDAPPYAYVFGQTYRCVLLDNSTSKQYDFAEPGTLGLEVEPHSAPPVPVGRIVVIRNSDDTYSVEVEAPDVHTLPDVQHTDSNGALVPLPALTPFVAAQCPVIVPGTVILLDSAGTALGSPVSVPPGGNVPLTAPDGTATARNSTGSAITSPTPVRSGGSEFLNIADSVITRPDGTTVGLPATLPSDVRNMRSGINYALSEAMWSGQTQAYTVGDEATFWAALHYRSVIHPYPLEVAQIGNTWTTLLSLNKWGDHRRFTDRLGTEVYADGIIHDHLYDMWWYRPSTMLTGSFNAAVPAAQALVVSGYGDWFLAPYPLLRSITNNGGGALLNYAPFSVTGQIVSSSTIPLQVGNCYHLFTTGAFSAASKSTSQSYLVCRRAA